jgi:hypothetical protein
MKDENNKKPTVFPTAPVQIVAWMHEWDDGELVPMLRKRDVDSSDIDSPKSVRPLVYGDTAPPAQPTVQEPVGEWVGSRSKDSDPKRIAWKPGYVMSAKVGDKIYTAPATPVPLTEPQRKAIYDAVQGLDVMKAILMTEAAYGSTEKGRP